MKKLLLCLTVSLVLGSVGVFAEESSPRAVAEKAYRFGFPLVIMDITRQVQTAPVGLNRLSHARKFPDATYTDFVSPNADTLYSIAWLDLKHSPVIFTVPEMKDRYYLMQFMDAWTNVYASIGPRTTGNAAASLFFTGPDWKGEVPEGMVHFPCPTNMSWLLGRIRANGPEDCKAVNALQDRFELEAIVPKKTDTAPVVDRKTPPIVQADALDAEEFFCRLNRLMADNPPAAADAPVMKEFQRIGVAPGRPFDPKSLPPDVWEEIQKGYADGKTNILKAPYGIPAGDWIVMPENIARFGTDYTLRILVARMGIGANLREDAIYPAGVKDSDGNPLNGKHRYVVRFEKGQLPPVRAFWSLTVYNADHFFVDNPIDRYALHGNDPLRYDADGGLSIYVQHESPGKDKESNWLPSPDGKMSLILRLYWPEESILDGSWSTPSLKRIDE